MSYEPYYEALLSVKGIGPSTAEEIMEKYPEVSDLKAALAFGEYDLAFKDEVTELMADFADPEPVEEVVAPDPEEPSPKPEPKKAPAARPKKKKAATVTVFNRSMQEVRLSTPNCVVRLLPGRSRAIPEALTKTKHFKTFQQRRWLEIRPS